MTETAIKITEEQENIKDFVRTFAVKIVSGIDSEKEHAIAELAEKLIEKIEFRNKGKHLLYGLGQIGDFFNVSVSTALNWRDEGWLEPAIYQIGRNIICDADIALELYKQQARKPASKKQKAKKTAELS